MSTFFIKSKPVFSNGPRSLPKNIPDCTILDSGVFDNFILVDKLFVKALGSLMACVSVSSSLYGKLVASLELAITFDERFKVIPGPFFIPDFNLLS